MSKVFVVWTFLIAGVFCDQNETSYDTKIVGGSPALPDELPFQVSIQYDGLIGSHFCGGSLITNRHVLSAGHCFKFINNSTTEANFLQIYMGNNKLDGNGIYAKVDNITVHPKFSPITLHNDIAVIKLSSEVNISSSMKSIKLRSTSIKVDEECRVSGWGSTKESGFASNDLLQVNVSTIDKARCMQLYNESYIPNAINEDMICAGDPAGGKDSCQGDSGGPLTCKGELTGIVSFGIGCARPQYPGVYTEVSKFKKWIDEMTNGATYPSNASFIKIFTIGIVLQLIFER